MPCGIAMAKAIAVFVISINIRFTLVVLTALWHLPTCPLNAAAAAEAVITTCPMTNEEAREPKGS